MAIRRYRRATVRPIAWRGQCCCPDSCSRSVNVVSQADSSARRAPQHTCKHLDHLYCAHFVCSSKFSQPRLVSPNAQQWESCTHNASPAKEVPGLPACLQHPAQGTAVNWFPQGSCQGELQHHPRETMDSFHHQTTHTAVTAGLCMKSQGSTYPAPMHLSVWHVMIWLVISSPWQHKQQATESRVVNQPRVWCPHPPHCNPAPLETVAYASIHHQPLNRSQHH